MNAENIVLKIEKPSWTSYSEVTMLLINIKTSKTLKYQKTLLPFSARRVLTRALQLPSGPSMVPTLGTLWGHLHKNFGLPAFQVKPPNKNTKVWADQVL